jgi:AcrR family transcriptional regulator
MSKKDIRLNILLAAIDVFGTDGVGEASLADVAKKAKVSPPLLKYHFPTMKSLFLEVMHLLVEDLRNASVQAIQKNATKGSLKALEAYALAPLQWAKEHPKKGAVWMYIYHLMTLDTQFAMLNKNIRTVGRDRISLLLYQAVERGDIKIRKDRPIEMMAYQLQFYITAAPLTFGTEMNGDFEMCKEALLKSIEDLLSIKLST